MTEAEQLKLALDQSIQRSDMNLAMANIAEAKYEALYAKLSKTEEVKELISHLKTTDAKIDATHANTIMGAAASFIDNITGG